MKRGEKGIQILAPVTGYRRRKDEAEGDTDSKPQPVLMGFRAVYVFDRLSRDVRPSLCVPDGIRECNFRKSPR